MKQLVKLFFALLISILLGAVSSVALRYIDHEWTLVSMQQAVDNMGDQNMIKNMMLMWTLAWWALLLLTILLIGIVWYLFYRRQFRNIFGPAMALMALFLLSACSSSETVVITPPNYGIVIDMSSPSLQATANDFGSGELMEVTQQRVNMTKCALNSVDYCPDKLIAEVPGAPESRIYTLDPNTGTAGANQALCFEAQGVNGCLDFSVSAIILRENARCYANKMGVKPKEEGGTTSRFHFEATPLAQALDSRVIQIAGALMTEATSDKSPLTLAYEKFSVFENLQTRLTEEVYERTCITLTDSGINGGVQWSSPEVQATIDQAVTLQNQIELAAKENEIAAVQAKGIIARTQMYSATFGLDAAIRLVQVEKWDGSYMPPYYQTPVVELSESAQVSGTVAAK